MTDNKEENYVNLIKQIEKHKDELEGYAIQIPFEELKKFPIDLTDRFNKKGYKCDFTSDSLMIIFD